MNKLQGDPEFPAIDPDAEDIDELDDDQLPGEDDLPMPGDGLVEPAGVPFDEEIERVIQPEPVGD